MFNLATTDYATLYDNYFDSVPEGEEVMTYQEFIDSLQ